MTLNVRVADEGGEMDKITIIHAILELTNRKLLTSGSALDLIIAIMKDKKFQIKKGEARVK